MQSLVFPFTSDGFLHELQLRENDVCLVKRSKGKVFHYEVVVIQHSAARTFPDGRTLPEREVYPSGGTWGTYGFTFRAADYDKARSKYFAIARKQGSKEKSNTNTAEAL